MHSMGIHSVVHSGKWQQNNATTSRKGTSNANYMLQEVQKGKRKSWKSGVSAIHESKYRNEIATAFEATKT